MACSVNLLMKNIKLIIIYTLLTLSFSGWAQQNIVDSLINILPTLSEDTAKVNALIELCTVVIGAEPERAIQLASDARDLSEKINFQKGFATALKYIGLGYSSQNMYYEATLNWPDLSKEIGNLR